MSPQQPNRLTRSEFLRTATGTVAAAATATSLGFPAPALSRTVVATKAGAA
jgi:broad specificity polyphosphatase/5'/3'-nucleotidase SurE